MPNICNKVELWQPQISCWDVLILAWNNSSNASFSNIGLASWKSFWGSQTLLFAPFQRQCPFPLIYRRNLLKEKDEQLQERYELKSWEHEFCMITAAALVKVQTLNPSKDSNPSKIYWVLNVRLSKLTLKMKAGMSSAPF